MFRAIASDAETIAYLILAIPFFIILGILMILISPFELIYNWSLNRKLKKYKNEEISI